MANLKRYDLEERTLEFSKRIIFLCRDLPKDMVNRRLGDQLIRSATSVGSNYREANETDSKKDFKNKIRIAKKEARETIYWIQLVIEANPQYSTRMNLLLQESQELMKILGAIYEKVA